MPQKNYTESEKKEISRAYRSLLRSFKKKFPQESIVQIRQAFDLATEAHRGMFRQSGEIYILHPIAVAKIVVEEMGLSSTSVIAALLHDTVEDTSISLQDIEKIFGSKMRDLVNGLTKITHSEEISKDEKVADNLKKMIITLASDVRVIFVKLADRLHNMRTLGSVPEEKKHRISFETLHIYVPFAHRLGLYNIKSELEDLAFMYLQPQIYQEINHLMKSTQAVRQRFLNQFSLPIQRALKAEKLNFEISYRPKSVYSIYKKMQRGGLKFDEIFDLYGLRIILDSPLDREKMDCWKVYTLITQTYQAHKERLRDWITTPRSNGYEALHLTVMSPKGKWVEIQIRSKRMNEIAEKGAASHWRYKENQEHETFLDTRLEEWLNKAKDLIIDHQDLSSIDLVNDFKKTLLSQEITTFTPAGKPIILPKGSNVLDFAFSVHSEIGQRCIGAKVDQKLTSINEILQEGNQVEVITADSSVLEENWLNLVISHKAKSAIKQALRQKRKNFEQIGKKKWLHFIQDQRLSKEQIQNLRKKLNYASEVELYYHLAGSDIDLLKILNTSSQINENSEKNELLLNKKKFVLSFLVDKNEDFQYLEKLSQNKNLTLTQLKLNDKNHFILQLKPDDL